MRSKISYAVAAILGGASVGAAAAEPAAGTTEGGALEEIIVTAQKREQSIQDVPISMQALTGQALQQLNVSTFDDYIKFLPSVTTASNGPGQNEVFMRGLSAGSQASQGSGSTGAWPNVAIYLDNQSGQLPNRNLDIYAADLNRIEVLEGPQGTLFGAGAEAGVIRYITNEPKLDKVEASVKAGYGITTHGDPNTDLTAVLNVPLIPNTMALRGVIYDDHRGGYIDNVPATFTRKSTDIGIHYAQYATACSTGTPSAGACPVGSTATAFGVPPGSPSLNNNSLTARAINPVTYKGIRVEALYRFNDDWDVLFTQSYQDMQSEGVFYQQPNASDGAPLQALQVTLFNNSYDKDKFESTAWTVNGRFAALKAVYTGGYLVRNVDQIGDYTNYARGVFADYYQCYGPAYDATLTPTCFSPSAIWHNVERNTHQQHEFRLSTPDDWRVRAIAGAYWEDNKLYDQTAWLYKNVPPCTATLTQGCLTNVGPFAGTTVVNPGVQGDNTSFYQDQVRDTKQTAFFVSVDFDLIPKVLTATLGTRHFQFKNSMAGSVLSSFGCFEAGLPPCQSSFSFNLDAQNLRDTESGYKSRGNLTWHITPDVMVYYTFSQGFRPGGFNQNGGVFRYAPGPAQPVNGVPTGVPQYEVPQSYSSDKLANNEVGWKTEFLNHRLQWNGALYRETWDNVQVAFFDPEVTGNIFFDTNGQNFVIKGVETSLVARVVPGLTLQGAASWNQSEQKNSPTLIDLNPASGNFGNPITQVCDTSGANCVPLSQRGGNPYGAIGSPSANAPPIQFSFRARYDWSIGGYTPYVQFGATHSAHSFTQAGANPTFLPGQTVSNSRGRFENPAYSVYDASFGVAKDAWYLNFYAENLSNSNASVFVSTDQFIVAQTPLRPRVLGAAFGYKF
ncbi:MAG: TonB-dependent receptor [Gammaproteobacteria bacterium]|nr:MAG: TonB-dependent receptor [Gammaproteobacteria bacterium]TLZ17699.1 MAG: TonB-dependent receptor [Gammaproteobacteria bacterium]